MKAVISLFFALLTTSAFPQKEANMWYFGSDDKALDFNSGNPILLTDNAIDNPVLNRNSCISDSSGNLLFYSDGENVWNKQHEKMPNGTGLNGYFNTWQSSIIIPNPENRNIYYLFTLENNAGSLYYSIIDLTQDAGKGDVISKNIFLTDVMTEKLTAVRHSNGKDFWVLTHKFNSNAFYSYLITETGVTATPVISSSGSIHTGTMIPTSSYTNTPGTMKVSPDGRYLALTFVRGLHNTTLDSLHLVELFYFNDQTGEVKFIRKLLSFPRINPYTAGNLFFCGDLEFSPNGSKLYIPIRYPINSKPYYSELFQFEISCLKASLDIPMSTITTGPMNADGLTGIQLGPNGKIYVSSAAGYWSTIHRPNLWSEACSFQHNSLFVSSGSDRAFPNFISSFLKQPDTIVSMSHLCAKDSTYFTLKDTVGVTNIQWQFYNKTNQLIGSSNELTTSYLYSDSGEYAINVSVSYNYKCPIDTLLTIEILNAPDLFLKKDTLLCEHTILHLDLANKGNSFLWQDGSTLPYYNVSAKDTLIVNVMNEYCIISDTIIVNFKPLPIINIGNDTILCVGDSLTISLSSEYQYIWQDQTEGNSYTITKSGTYQVDASNGCGVTASSREVKMIFCCEPFIPNLITPNNDGQNDYFLISCIEDQNWKLEIINRWGKRVFLSQKYNNDFYGGDLEEGVYYYSLSNLKNKNYKGWVQIIK